ncbi:MAG: methyltransferase [Candidatus Cloacimonetes bacterium]|nr:methyltransferase [Candidatus Cloacimonadota bacterium]
MKLKPVKLPFGKTIYQTENGQSISSDVVDLVDLIIKKETQNIGEILELGSGNGIISIMLKYHRRNWNIVGIEIQEHLVELSNKNSELSELSINFRKADIRSFSSQNNYDLIISNPPFYSISNGRISPIKERAISRHEILCTLEDVIFAIDRNLKEAGKSYIIYPKFRLPEIEKVIKKVDLRIVEKNVSKSLKNKQKLLIILGRRDK